MRCRKCKKEIADDSLCGNVTYCAAVLSESAYTREASAFLDYLTGAEAADFYTRAGFAPLSERNRYSDTQDAEGQEESWASEENLWEGAFPEEYAEPDIWQ